MAMRTWSNAFDSSRFTFLTWVEFVRFLGKG